MHPCSPCLRLYAIFLLSKCMCLNRIGCLNSYKFNLALELNMFIWKDVAFIFSGFLNLTIKYSFFLNAFKFPCNDYWQHQFLDTTQNGCPGSHQLSFNADSNAQKKKWLPPFENIINSDIYHFHDDLWQTVWNRFIQLFLLFLMLWLFSHLFMKNGSGY